MARREGRPDPKEAALAATRCLNPHPEQVTDPEFLASDFFDARDMVQVKYEMVRKVKADGAPVTAAAAAFGYSRPSYYQAAAALERAGTGKDDQGHRSPELRRDNLTRSAGPAPVTTGTPCSRPARRPPA